MYRVHLYTIFFYGYFYVFIWLFNVQISREIRIAQSSGHTMRGLQMSAWLFFLIHQLSK